MPFQTGTVSEVASRGGKASAKKRWGDKTPETIRNRQLKLNLSQEEKNMIDEKARDFGISKADLVIAAVSEYNHV
jgi:hypothetical protein